ncbi:Uncharacterized protein TPAR_01902 [Tolypocladium paradoxum]|uniref:Uncharacterized protein n=1 Tax=Tolypocladium paradoxum TaxID=94208 RepID=A0A2S4L630_9HYPO|nr:Uncharacterized protein TPAR_01902 [Tolypocladium paradoxum]
MLERITEYFEARGNGTNELRALQSVDCSHCKRICSLDLWLQTPLTKVKWGFASRQGSCEWTLGVTNRIWSYEGPTAAFGGIRGYLSFYAGAPWERLSTA